MTIPGLPPVRTLVRDFAGDWMTWSCKGRGDSASVGLGVFGGRGNLFDSTDLRYVGYSDLSLCRFDRDSGLAKNGSSGAAFRRRSRCHSGCRDASDRAHLPGFGGCVAGIRGKFDSLGSSARGCSVAMCSSSSTRKIHRPSRLSYRRSTLHCADCVGIVGETRWTRSPPSCQALIITPMGRGPGAF